MFRTRTGLIAAALLILALPAVPAVIAQQESQKPKDNWQKPKEFQKPRDTWQTPGEIQVPKGLQAIRTEEAKCTKRFSVGADALFEFDQATLTPDAEETLNALVSLLAPNGRAPEPELSPIIEGHTDAKGSGDYNQTLSEKRAQAVKDWLAARGVLPVTAPIRGWGERRPVAPNTKPDGSDDPAGRQKNRRVEVVLDLCKNAR